MPIRAIAFGSMRIRAIAFGSKSVRRSPGIERPSPRTRGVVSVATGGVFVAGVPLP